MKIAVHENPELKLSVLKVGAGPPARFRGDQLFNNRYGNIFLSAPTRSGKTNLIYNILKARLGKGDKVAIFADTHEKDPGWEGIKQMLDQKKIDYSADREFLDDQGSKLDILHSIEATPDHDTFVVLDDISYQIKDKSVAKLLKSSRHSRIIVLISSQYIMDLAPDARSNITCWLVRGLSQEKLEDWFKSLNLSIDFGSFKKMYDDATRDQYRFFYVDRPNEDFRSNFDRKYLCSRH